MNTKITPFDISLIVEFIGSYLCRKDFANCLLVNKTCYAQFTRLYWRKLKLVHKQDPSLPIPFDSEDQKSLRANSYHTRYLTIVETGDAKILRFLADPSSICNSLVELNCTHKGSLFSHDIFSLVLDLLDRNPVMKKLSLLGLTGNNTNSYSERFFRSLSNHRSLITLRLLDPPEVHPVAYRGLLRHLPPNLENLVLRWGVKDVKELKNPHPKSLRLHYPRIRMIALSLDVHEQERTTIIPFLLRCRNVESLELLSDWEGTFDKIIPVFRNEKIHPNLKAITVGTLCKFRGWERFATSMQNRIRSVSLGEPASLNFLWHLLPTSADLIESVRIQSTCIQSRDITQILTSCPNLRSFSIFTTLAPINASFLPTNGSYGLTTLINSNSPQEADWVCLFLEDLEITFSDCRRESGHIEDLHLQEGQTAKGIKRAYQQIGRLSKLQNLRLGWRTTDNFINDVNLDLSFGSGLRNLRGLKELKVLDISCLPRVRIESEEVEWIVENWPELHTIKGYFKKDTKDVDVDFNKGVVNDFDDHDQELIDAKWNGFHDPPHIEWLRCLKPDILIT